MVNATIYCETLKIFPVRARQRDQLSTPMLSVDAGDPGQHSEVGKGGKKVEDWEELGHCHLQEMCTQNIKNFSGNFVRIKRYWNYKNKELELRI